MQNKLTWIALLAVAIVAIVGLDLPKQQQHLAGAVPAGSSFLTARAAGAQVITSSSTILALQNNDGAGRVINSLNFYLQTGATTTTYTVACATSSTQFWPSSANGNVILQQNLQNIGAGTTTGAGLYFASTSPGLSGLAVGVASTSVRIWASNEWMVCKETSSPANDTLPASADGIISFPFTPGI